MKDSYKLFIVKDSYEPRKLRSSPNFYGIGKIIGYIIMGVIGYFATITLRLIFGF